VKLLFDHNLSHRLVPKLNDVFPGSTQTRHLNFNEAEDQVIWAYARANGFVIVTLDKDFADLALLRGAPPKVVWLRCGNCTVAEVETLLRKNLEVIASFETRETADVLEIWP
jgi:predicted nuclease of predicted toxin-antitoxin system